MKEVNKLSNQRIYEDLMEVLRIGNEAIQKAKEENKKLGLPDFFWKRGKIYYILPDGSITTQIPEVYK